MAIVAKPTGESRTPVPAGNYFGVCVGVYDIGTQPSPLFGPKHQVVLQFELHRKKGVARGPDGQPLLIANFYNLSFSDKANLRVDVQKILGRTFSEAEAKNGFDVARLLETGCRMSVAHAIRDDGSVRDAIAAFMCLEPNDPELEPVSEATVYELDVTRPIPDRVPDWIQKKIQASGEWQAQHGRPAQPSSRSSSYPSGQATARLEPRDHAENTDLVPF
jgi:hypothetical protein